MLSVDFHTHSLASGHALNSIEELLRHADRLGMQGIAVTDHGPGTDNAILLKNSENFSQVWQNRIVGTDIHYFNVLISRYQAPSDIQVRLFKGIECNIYGQGTPVIDLPPTLIDKFDLVIASLHPLPYIFDLKDKVQVTERLLEAMEEPLDIIGHPFQKAFDLDMALIVQTAAEKNVVLELNDDSIRQQKTEVRSMQQMLQLAKKHDCRISLSSDTHAANELGSDETTSKLLAEARFPRELIVNDSIEAAVRFVEERKRIRAQMKAKIAKNNAS